MKQVKKTLQILTIAPALLFLAGCGDRSNNYKENRPKSPAELREELKYQELSNPLEYLSDKGVTLQKLRKKVRNGGILRDAEYADDGAIIEGDFINDATLAKFKDIVVKVSYYSQTKTLIEEKSYVFYEYYEPHSTKHFSLRVDEIPQAYSTFSFQLTAAKPANG